MKKLLRSCASVLAVAAGIGMLATDAMATEGYFQHAYGLRHKALAGAGVASIEDATGISLNPAGLVGVGNQFNMGLSLFMPFRKYSAKGTGLLPAGTTQKSKKNIFPVPTLAYVRQLDADSAFALSIFGNGGMNTTYGSFDRTCPNPAPPPATVSVTGSNALCGSGKLGVDLMQMFVSAAYARNLTGGVSIGVAPLFAMQRFKAYGLQAFAGMSSDSNNLTNRGYSYSYGAGARIGIQIKPSDMVSFGASYQTKIWMSKFKKYKGLFAEGGDFDIPANLQVGIAFMPTSDLKVMLDYRHIFYSDVKSIANEQTSTGQLGSKSGPGFGWRDTNTIKVGLEYQATDDLILRAGYSYMFPQVMKKNSTLFNVLAPGVIRHQFTGGATYRVDQSNDIDFAFMFATGKHKGPEYINNAGTWVNSGGTIKLNMHQFEASVGWTYNFDGSSKAR